MKKSELRQIIKEELLKEEEGDLGRDIDRVVQMAKDKFSDWESDKEINKLTMKKLQRLADFFGKDAKKLLAKEGK